MAAVVPYALSVHGFIDKVGADAGFAAIIGVALVVIMLFVHARETASLRARAEDAEDRVEYLERAVEQLGRVASQATQLAQAANSQSGHARPGVAAAPAAARTATAARPVPAPAVAAAYAGAAAQPRTLGPPPQLPAAPFMTGGPALSSATRLLPEPGAASSNGHMNGNSAVGAPPPVPAPATTTAPAPSTAAAGAPTPMPQIPSPARPLDPRGDTEPPRSRSADAGSRAPRRNYGHAAEPKSSRRRIIPVLVAVLLVAVIAVAAVLVLGHHHSKGSGRTAAVTHTHSSTTSSQTKSAKKHKHAVTVDPRSVTVAVLNGTTTANLAADVSQKLGKLGFQQGKTTNFNSTSLTTTTIGFLPGHRPQALAVAKALKVKYSNVLQVNASTRQLVCPTTGTCADNVFVVLGSDLASNA
jgi:hypothetical protein